MNKKIIIAGLLFSALVNAGCNSFVARKDSSQIVKFKNMELDKNLNTLTLYKIDYPTTKDEKEEFYKEFETLLSKMVAHKKSLNLILPLELYKDMNGFKNGEFASHDSIFKKYSYLLSEEDKISIDKNVDVAFPKNVGSIQEYLNKQVAYLYNYLNEADKYDKDTYYTELDKERLIKKILDGKKNLIDLYRLVEDNCAVEITKEDGNISLPVYIKTDSREDVENLKSKLVIVDGNIKDEVIPKKIVLIQGKTVETIKDAKIETFVKEATNPLSLINKLEDESKLELRDMADFSIKEIKGLQLNKVSVEWRIEG